ncbi:MAG: AAA family ATPase [Clostridiales bacterium]|nr:AAA family ATPase [Clostridiales bacterium]
MKLYSLTIEGFRKHLNTKIIFSDSTFLIGENNVGKSSVLYALDYLLGASTSISMDEFYAIEDNGERKIAADNIIFTAEFRNIPREASTWRGFKGRLLNYESEKRDPLDTGIKFIYRKTYPRGGKVKIETLENPKILKEEFRECICIQDYIDAGLPEEELSENIKKIRYDKKLTSKEKSLFDNIEYLYDIDESQESWVENPGGIPQNVLSRLPKYLLIPAQDSEGEISGTSGTLQKTLNELFNEVREKSENYKLAQEYLNKLAKELDPSDKSTEISKMIGELNSIISDVFPHTGISAAANLSDADKVIKPAFDIQMNSNVATPSNLQGTGLIRSTVFALLRYKALRDNQKDASKDRQLIIGFEEPEIYLHPNAISKMRDTIYALAETGNNQIICTTHSPYMIDVSKKPKQTLNSLFLKNCKIDSCDALTVGSIPFNITKEFLKLQENEKDYIKMLLRVEDAIAKCFFVKRVLIVEGDTEQVVLSETISKMPSKMQSEILAEWYILRARGKAAIIPLIKYLRAMHIDIYVMHDKDENTSGAVVFNNSIRQALSDDTHLFVLENCIEDVLGYSVPTSDKPYKAYCYIKDNWKQWKDINDKWKEIVEAIFNVSIKS